MIENEHIDYFLVQRIYETQSWKKYSIDDEYLADLYLSMAMSYDNIDIEELVIALDLNNLSFIHDKKFMDFMHENAVALLDSAVERGLICEATRDDYMGWLDKMKIKLHGFFLNR